MSGFPFRDIVLPAVLVSSATFAGLTLPFAFFTSEPVLVELPPFFSGEIQPIFATERKDMAIRYVGFAIVSSVAAGMGTVELIRTRQASRELSQTQKQVSNLQFSLQQKEAQLETLKQSGDAEPPQMLQESDMLPDEDSGFPLLSLEQYLAAETPALDAVPAGELCGVLDAAIGSDAPRLTAEWAVPFSVAVQSPPEPLPAAAVDVDPAPVEVCRDYVTCRVRVPQLQGSLFAIVHQGEYYSLFRFQRDEAQAVAIATRLNRSGRAAVMTHTETGFAVWVREQEAYPDLIA